MDAKTRNLDIFKTIVLLYLIAFLFFRIFYAISSQEGITAPQSLPVNQSAATTESAPTSAAVVSPTTSEPAVNRPVPAAALDSAGIPSCTLAAPARISGVGARVRVTNALIPLRSRPAVPSSSFLGPLPIGTELEVVSMPICEPYLESANLWWQVRTLSGKTGWAAEASAIKPVFYYLEEIK